MDVCEQGTVLKYGDCVPDTSVGNYDIAKQHLQTGETISESGMFTSIIVGSLGPIVIVFFIALYAVKKIRTKESIE